MTVSSFTFSASKEAEYTGKLHNGNTLGREKKPGGIAGCPLLWLSLANCRFPQGGRSCQGWPEATAKRREAALTARDPCGHFPGSEGQHGCPGWHYRCDATCPAIGTSLRVRDQVKPQATGRARTARGDRSGDPSQEVILPSETSAACRSRVRTPSG